MLRYALTLACLYLFYLAPAWAIVDRDQSQKLYEDALEFLRADSFSEAAIQLRNALQQNPNNLAARIALGQVLLQQNQPRAAIKELETAQTMGGDENLFLVSLAQAYLEVAEPEHVITGFVAEGHKPQVDGELSLLQAEAYLQLSDLKSAEEAFLNAGTLLPVDPRPILGRARLQMSKGRLDKATALIDEALALSPDSFDVWMFKALVHRDHQQYPESIKAFERALQLNPMSGRALTARAAMWMDLGETEKAKLDLANVKDLDSDTLETIYLRTLIMFREGHVEEARQSLRESADQIREIKDDYRSKLPETTLMLGVVAYFEGNYSEAVTHLQAYMTRFPGHTGAMRYLAASYLELREGAEAIALIKPSSQREPPRDPMLLSILAEAYRTTGNYDAATKYYQAALDLAPDAAGLGIRLAAARLDAGHPGTAITELEKLTSSFPELVDAWVQLARVYVKTGDMKKAAATADILIERFGDVAEVNNVAGATYLATGDLDKARLHLSLAQEKDPTLILPQINLARLYRMQGEVASAEAQYRTTLERFPRNTTATLELAQLLLDHNELTEAGERVKELLEKDPTLYAAHELKLNVTFASERDAEEIRAAVYDLLKAFPKEPKAELLAGRAYRLLRQIPDARIHFRRAVELAAFDTDVLFAAANQQYAIADFTGALWTLTKAEQGSSGHVGAGVLKAAVLVELKEFTKADEALQQLIAKHGETAEILTVRGDRYMAEREVAKAIEDYANAYRLVPGERTLQTLFRAQVAGSRFDDAGALMRAWLEQHPDDLGSMHLFAQMLMHQKRWDEARETYEKLQATGIEDVVMLNNLAVCYRNLKDPRALPTAEAAYKMAPKDPSVVDTYGWILLDEGQPERGLALLREAFARASTNPAIRYHIGLALARLGRDSEAKEEIEAAISSSESFSARDDAMSLLEKIKQKIKQ